MEICKYVDLQNMIYEAKLVEADCIAENDDSFEKGLTKGMNQHPKAKSFLLGLHETVEHRGNNNRIQNSSSL